MTKMKNISDPPFAFICLCFRTLRYRNSASSAPRAFFGGEFRVLGGPLTVDGTRVPHEGLNQLPAGGIAQRYNS
jgi:hypothetical protein